MRDRGKPRVDRPRRVPARERNPEFVAFGDSFVRQFKNEVSGVSDEILGANNVSGWLHADSRNWILDARCGVNRPSIRCSHGPAGRPIIVNNSAEVRTGHRSVATTFPKPLYVLKFHARWIRSSSGPASHSNGAM